MNKNASSTANSHGNENSSKSTSTSHKNGKHSVNLQKRGSTRFQFGLIIAMSVVYFGLEASFETFESEKYKETALEEEIFDYHTEPYVLEKKTPKKKQVLPKKRINPEFKIIEDDAPDAGLEDFILEPEENTSSDLNPGDIEYDKDPPVIEEIMFRLVEDAPVFPGCEDVTKDERLGCFTDKIQRHVQENFRYPEAAQEMNIEGKVHVGFRIGKDGYITDVQLRGPHKLLENEAARIIGKLPKMTPGKQRGVPVKVPFNIPINFKLN